MFHKLLIVSYLINVYNFLANIIVVLSLSLWVSMQISDIFVVFWWRIHLLFDLNKILLSSRTPKILFAGCLRCVWFSVSSFQLQNENV